MKKFLIPFLLVFSSVGSAFTFSDNYRSGVEVCEINKSARTHEIENWVEAPVDYLNPNGEKTLLYSYTKKSFNKNLPSVIFFTGGPGVSSRATEFNLPNTNLIFFEQRGISCSRPKNKELFLNPFFYSSENTAKDALEIMKSFGIDSMTVYGQSYGTIPATIFASFFPNHTKALIIEGVIYEANKTLWNSEIKKSLLQNFFNNLPESKKNEILKLSSNNFLPPNWFSKLGGMILYINDGVDVFDIFLDNVLAMEEENLKTFVLNFYPNEQNEEEFIFGDVMMGMIGCQEISMHDSQLSMTLVFEGHNLVYDHENVEREQRCKPLGLENFKGHHYQAILYPVTVPSFYLLGENDGATDLNQGIAHFKNVPQNQKTMLVLSKGGHLPSLSLLKDNRPCDPLSESDQCHSLIQNQLMVSIFENIISQSYIDSKMISDFNENGPLFWTTF